MIKRYAACTTWSNVEQALRSGAERLSAASCLLGFDGYLDRLYRVVRNKDATGNVQHYATISEFAGRIQQAAGKSADLEIQLQQVRFGGNAPLMAAGLARLGASVTCLSLAGDPDLRGPFEELARRMKLISLGESCLSTIFEFDDGKLMFGDITPAEKLDWDELVRKIGIESLARLFMDSDLIALLNWSGLPGMEAILDGFCAYILPGINAGSEGAKKTVFIDLADPSAKSDENFQALAEQISQIARKCRVILGLNENEARRVCQMLCEAENDVMSMGTGLLKRLGIHGVQIHLRDRAFFFHEQEALEVEGFFVEKPLFSTGGGDHFNAGFCAGLLLGLTPRDALVLGNAVSSFYVSKGESPSIPDLLDQMNQAPRKKTGC